MQQNLPETRLETKNFASGYSLFLTPKRKREGNAYPSTDPLTFSNAGSHKGLRKVEERKKEERMIWGFWFLETKGKKEKEKGENYNVVGVAWIWRLWGWKWWGLVHIDDRTLCVKKKCSSLWLWVGVCRFNMPSSRWPQQCDSLSTIRTHQRGERERGKRIDVYATFKLKRVIEFVYIDFPFNELISLIR